MTFREIVETASAVIVSLGGGGLIVVGLSSYLGKIWADRGLERQRHEYATLNIALQSKLDAASRRLQVELDSLSLVHKLRTQEEFARLSELWKRIVNLRNSFVLMSPSTTQVAVSQEQIDLLLRSRTDFNDLLDQVQDYLSSEALFVPKDICALAQSALIDAAREKHNFLMFGIRFPRGKT